ncbi:MAG TPA: ester cyclase [Solirubrobacteraceae bacterium]
MTREVVRQFIDGAINGRDLAVVDKTWADDMTWHGGSMGTYESKAAFLEFAAANAGGAWEDMHLEIRDTIASGNQVVLRFTDSGTNVGPFMGNPATGKHAEWLDTGIYKLRDGRITEGWFAEDILGLVVQLAA